MLFPSYRYINICYFPACHVDTRVTHGNPKIPQNTSRAHSGAVRLAAVEVDLVPSCLTAKLPRSLDAEVVSYGKSTETNHFDRKIL